MTTTEALKMARDALALNADMDPQTPIVERLAKTRAALAAIDALPSAPSGEPAEPLKGWKLNHVQKGPEDGMAEIGYLDPEDDHFSPIVTVDTGLYYQDKQAHPLAVAILGMLADATAQAAHTAAAPQAVPKWWTCQTHGPAMPQNAWGCPECVRELREENKRLTATPPAAAAPQAPDYAAMLSWLHESLREAGMCIDGGTCHHQCKPDPKAECFRQSCCVPLAGSGLAMNWTIPAAPQAQAVRAPLTDEKIDAMRQGAAGLNFVTLREFRVIARAVEAAHGITAAPSQQGDQP